MMFTNEKEIDTTSDTEQFAARGDLEMTSQSATGDDTPSITLPPTVGSGGTTTK